jgi:hypothetical protein
MSFTPFLEANGTSFHGNKRNRGHGHGRSREKKKIIEVKGNIFIICTKKKMLLTTKSRTIIRRNKMKTKVYKINLQRTMKINVTGVV